MKNFISKLNFKGDIPHLDLGENVFLGDNVIIGPNCKLIEIGYGSFIGDNVYIDVPRLSVGEYTTIHKNTTLHGYKDLSIGHNCWIGQNCIIDSIAGTEIGNNVGIGTYSQLWTHMKFGDCLEGCQWKSEKKLIIEDDCWFVGHCIVSPITAHKKSMLLVGGVVTKDMEENHIYGGCPAIDMTAHLGYQFNQKSTQQKRKEFLTLYFDFMKLNNIEEDDFKIIVKNSLNEREEKTLNATVFYLEERVYEPTYSQIEYKFMKFLLYDKAKFIPLK